MCSRNFIPAAAVVLVAFTCVFSAFAFLPPSDTVGPLTLSMEDPGEVTVLGQRMCLNITVRNGGPTKLDGTVRLAVIDDWRIKDPASKKFSVGPNAHQTIPFTVIPGERSHAALYPVHAFAEFRQGSVPFTAHAILISSVAASAVTAISPGAAQLPELNLPKNGRLRLDAPRIFRPRLAVPGAEPAALPVGWQGSEANTGASIELLNVERGDRRHALAMHPPWRKAWGEVSVDFHVKLPTQTPITLNFATAIRDHSAEEPASDGVEFTVLLKDVSAFKTLSSRFSAAKRWEMTAVDLSAYAGREVTLRLMTGPGPAHNTSCDQSYWAEPTLVAGEPPKPELETDRLARRKKALELAKSALHGGSSPWSWNLQSEAGTTGAAVVPGPSGLADAFIVFSDDRRELVFDGFTVEVDGQALGANVTDLPCIRVDSLFAAGRGTITCDVAHGEAPLAVQARLWAEKGALRIAFSMPGTQRDSCGEPRFTALAIGPASELAHRVYAGFGNVIQDPERFDLQAGGFTLSTRHVGMDFKNGLSLVQACDIFPDRFHVDPERRSYSLVAHHDATFSLVPSTRQAFAAARAYRGLAGFRPAGGVAGLLGRICLDQWGGDYRRAAQGVETAARYGITDAVFVKHEWQRWGYDYRLPGIYPPAGSFEDFCAMVEACRRNGILFCPHDNYIDFYPDADGYSYDHISFDADGTPQKAWFNSSRDAQSYRWSPNAFGPQLESNLKQICAGFAPTAYFVDVFSSVPPMDFYDSQGRFFSKIVTADRWGAAFDRIREILGNNAPTISEAGHDALIGHLDAGEADHSAWLPDSKQPEGYFRWSMKAGDGERVPWHDMASHGSFVLLGGGLGPRYAGWQDETLHGYGSDDYLNLTVLGGRNPMCDGPFSRRAVMTYWLLHDVCNSLARDEMLAHEFADDDIHRQIAHFSNGGTVTVNRGTADWTTDGHVLPSFGFIAKAGENEADITRRDGVISACAKSPGVLFVDARPDVADADGQVLAKVVGVEDLGGRRFRIRIEWEVRRPLPPGFRPFVHFVDDKRVENEGILFQGGLELDPLKLGMAGTYPTTAEVAVPNGFPAPAEIAVRFGLCNPDMDWKRLQMQVATDPRGRARGGIIQLERDVIRWKPEPPDPVVEARSARLNMRSKTVDFGPASTNGAFRILHEGTVWKLIPLPGSTAFHVELRLDQLNASGQKVREITAVNADGNAAAPVRFQQDGQAVRFETSDRPFAYRISFIPPAAAPADAKR